MNATTGQPLTMAEFADMLREHDITSTLQRVEIAQVILSKPQHLSAEQVLEGVNRGRNIVSKATVYNTLRLFAQKGLVREVIADPTKVFYEPMTTEHHHFYNIETGELVDIEPGRINIQDIPDAPNGSTHVGVDVVIRIRNGVDKSA